MIIKQFERVLDKKRELDPQYNELREKIDALNIQISALNQALKAAGKNTDKIRAKYFTIKPSVKTVRKEDTIPDLIVKIFKAYKKPLHYKEIHRQLHSGGFWIRGKDPANTVLAYISRNKHRFIKAPEAGRGFYKIKQ